MKPESSNTPTAPAQAIEPILENNRRKRALWLISGITIVMAAAVLAYGQLHHPYKAAAQDDESHKYEASVTLDDKTFVPANLSVKTDTRVYFENKSANGEDAEGTNRHIRLTASSPTSEPELSAIHNILPKGGYAYSFKHPGTFIFYEVEKPDASFTLTVTADR